MLLLMLLMLLLLLLLLVRHRPSPTRLRSATIFGSRILWSPTLATYRLTAIIAPLAAVMLGIVVPGPRVPHAARNRLLRCGAEVAAPVRLIAAAIGMSALLVTAGDAKVIGLSRGRLCLCLCRGK